jgi:hypothetical protein
MGSPVRGTAHIFIRAQASSDELQVKKWNGRDHLVVPTVMLVEGVLHSSNAPNPALALASEFGIFPQGWDGRPVVYGHPQANGEPTSANSPQVWEDQVIGHLFGSGMKGKKKLRTYMWLDKEKAPKAELEALERGESVEVSTGLYALEEHVEGDFEGKQYKSIWRNIVPDHLALLPMGSVGACSIEDGCGAPRNNLSFSYSKDTPMSPSPQVAAAVVTTAAPLNCDKCVKEIKDSTLKALKNFFTSAGLQTNELSDTDRRTALEAALGAAYTDTGFCMILAVFAQNLVYAHLNMDTWEWHTYQRTYSVAEGGAISLSADVTEVRPETKYVPLVIAVAQPTTNAGDPAMSTSNPNGAAAQPAANAAQPQVPAAQPAVQPVQPAAQPTAQPAAEPQVNAEVKKAKNLQELMEMAEPAVKEQLQGIIKSNTDRAAALIKALEGKIGLSAEELKVFSLDNLEKMAAKLNVAPPPADFSGAAGGAVNTNAAAAINGGGQLDFTPATPMFAENLTPPVKQQAPQRQAA